MEGDKPWHLIYIFQRFCPCLVFIATEIFHSEQTLLSDISLITNIDSLFSLSLSRRLDSVTLSDITVLRFFFPNESGDVQLILPCLQLNYTAPSPLTSLELAKRKVGTLKCCPPLRPQEWDTNCHQPRSPSTTPTASCMHWASACPPRSRTIWGEDRRRSTGQMGLNSQLVWNLVRNKRRISGVWSALKQIRS